MNIESIRWIDQNAKEAIITVEMNGAKIQCYSYPCDYQVGDKLVEQLECLDTNAVMICEKNDKIIKLESVFGYELRGRIIDVKNGIVDVGGFIIHIDENEIPGDVNVGMYIQFSTNRVDVW